MADFSRVSLIDLIDDLVDRAAQVAADARQAAAAPGVTPERARVIDAEALGYLDGLAWAQARISQLHGALSG